MRNSLVIKMTGYPALRAGVLVVLLCATQSGCSLLPGTRDNHNEQAHSMPPLYRSGATAPDHANGAIYQATTSLALFEDQKARRIGDILTINLVESTNATKSSSTSTSKSTDASVGNPTVLGYPVTRNGVPVLSGSLDSEQAFSGEGGASQSNRLEGSVTVTVIDRLPNGNLVVSGEKWLTLNQGKEYVRVSGIVRPLDVLADNSISSEKVANARIEYAGKGPLADSNRMNWLARFFNSPWLPF